MKKLHLLFLTIVLITTTTTILAQNVGINATGATPNASALLDLSATDKGLLVPRLTVDQVTALGTLPAAAQGLLIYQTNGTDGFYYNTSTGTTPSWVKLNQLPASRNLGDIAYWNGSAWIAISTSAHEGHIFQVIDGVPTWGAQAYVPGAPTIGTAEVGVAQATVSYTESFFSGSSAITSYTATSSPGEHTGTISQAGSGTITVTGLSNGVSYTFTVTATNAAGTSAPSAASNAVTPLLAAAIIGGFRAGGVVFWVDPADATHGLVCAVSDQSAAIQWYNGSNITTGATGTAIGTGSANTDAIINIQGATATDYAAGLAKAYSGGGFNDWFLPSIDELDSMYIHKATINTTAGDNGGNVFGSGYYWSSTEASISSGWRQNFTNGFQSLKVKNYSRSVRAVRAF